MRGVFATRAPSRPTPIGLYCVRLVAIDGARLKVAGLDILDGTPLLDIKPYVPDCDVLPVQRVGWYASSRRTFEHAEISRPFLHFDLSQLGLLKGRSPATSENVSHVISHAVNMLQRNCKPAP
jgi:hypothetical protein